MLGKSCVVGMLWCCGLTGRLYVAGVEHTGQQWSRGESTAHSGMSITLHMLMVIALSSTTGFCLQHFPSPVFLRITLTDTRCPSAQLGNTHLRSLQSVSRKETRYTWVWSAVNV